MGYRSLFVYIAVSRYQPPAHDLLTTAWEGLAMIAKQPISRSQTPEAPDPIQLAHIDSELCWCDPVIDFDEIGQQSIIHNEVTWN